jgi:hypothetical protein
MKNKISLFKKIGLSMLFLLASFSANAGAEWNGSGVIKLMYIYPTYAIIEQGNVGSGPANCSNDSTWSIDWSKFDTATQQRIMSSLLTARSTKQPITVAIVDNACGPEGKKLTSGQIIF